MHSLASEQDVVQQPAEQTLPLAPRRRCLATLSDLEQATVVEIDRSNTELFQRLHTMGLYPGSQVRLLARAPLGDPISFSTLGYVISLRRSEAERVIVSERAPDFE